MIIAILSDIHKKKNPYNDLNISDTEFLQILKDLVEQYDQVYINGDYLDLWCSMLPTEHSQIDTLKRIYRQYKRSINFVFKNPKIKLMRGNHDNALSYLLDHHHTLKQDIIKNTQGQKILIWHGNVDILNSKYIGIGKFLNWVEFAFERLFKRFRLKFLYKFMNWGIYYFGFKNKHQKDDMLKKINKDNDIVCVVNGHTHKPEIDRFIYRDKQRIYVNTGYFRNNHKQVTIINTETLEIKSIFL